MNLFRMTALLLGSVYFFPISCTTSMMVGTHVIRHMDARDASKGEMPHKQAHLMVVLPDASLMTCELGQLNDFKKKNPQVGFLLPTHAGSFSVGKRGKVHFVVTDAKPEVQTIEVAFDDATGSFFKYEASQKTIKPLYTQLWHHGYMFSAIPYALAIAFALHLTGLAMRRTLENAP